MGILPLFKILGCLGAFLEHFIFETLLEFLEDREFLFASNRVASIILDFADFVELIICK